MRKTPLIIFAVIAVMGVLFLARDRTSREEKPEDAPVRMAYLQNDIHHLALWVALEKGYFQEEGVEVEISGIFRAGPELMNAFTAGVLDMAYVGEAPSTFAVANKTADVTVVAQVNTEGSALVVARASSGIKAVSDLEGKTVGVPGHATVQDFLLRKALFNAGVDSSRVNILIIKPPEMIGALRTDQIDAFIAWEPYPSKAAVAEVGRNLASSKDIWPDHPCCVLVSDSKFMESKPGKVDKVVRAHVRATEFIRGNKEEAVRIGVKYTGMDEPTVRRALQFVEYTYVPSVDGEGEYVRFLSELGYIKVDDIDAFVSDFINEDFLNEIEAR
jgi:NitT/TauT family transport system substrate-binding protein